MHVTWDHATKHGMHLYSGFCTKLTGSEFIPTRQNQMMRTKGKLSTGLVRIYGALRLFNQKKAYGPTFS